MFLLLRRKRLYCGDNGCKPLFQDIDLLDKWLRRGFGDFLNEIVHEQASIRFVVNLTELRTRVDDTVALGLGIRRTQTQHH